MLSRIFSFSFVDACGIPLNGGKLYSYESESTVPVDTYKDPDGTTLNTNPILLDSRGTADIYVDSSKLYKFILQDSAGRTVWSVDKYTCASGGGSGDISTATSTYDPTGTQQVNGTAVASALSSYMPLSRLKPSTDMAGFDSDDTNAYTGKAIGQKITDAISGNVGGWLGNKTVDEVNELEASEMKTGDYVTLTDGGTVTLGNVAVTAGDEIYWVSSTSVWQKKDNTVYVKHTDIASSSGTGVVRASSDDGKVEVNSSGVMSVNGWSTVKNDVSTAQTNISTLQSTTAQHTSDIASVNSAIIAMSVDKQGGDGKYIRSISQSNGKISVEAVSLDTDLTDSSLGDNAPSSAAVKTYVDAQVDAEATARESAVAAEASARDSAISSAIATEVTNRNTAIENCVWEAKYDSETETLKFMNLSFTAS